MENNFIINSLHVSFVFLKTSETFLFLDDS